MKTLTVTPAMLPKRVDAPDAFEPVMGLRRVLPAIIVKELRQNLLFFALILVIGSVTFCMLQDFIHPYNRMNILLNSSMQNSIAIVASIAGLLLGIFQPLADRNFDIWSFATHRPIARSVLFYGRVLAGLILYFVGIGLPLAVLLLYAASPKGGPFFIWPFMLPSISAFLLGFPFYFAGLLVSDRRAKFYGSAGFPVCVAAAAAVATTYLPYFLAAVLVSVVTGGLLFFAARRSMISHGYTLWPKERPVALFITLLLAFSLVGMPAIFSQRAALQRKWRHYIWDPYTYSQVAAPQFWGESYLTILPDGSAARNIVMNVTSASGKTSVVESFTDMQGVPIPPPDEREKVLLDSRTYYSSLIARPEQYREDQSEAYNYLNPSNQVLEAYYASETDRHRTFYYYGVKSRGVFYVYEEFRPDFNREEKIITFLGTLGESGLAKPGERATPFDVELRMPEMNTAHTLYSLDKVTHSFKKLFETAADETIQNWTFTDRNNSSDPLPGNIYIAMFTSKRFLLMSRSTGAVRMEFPITRYPDAQWLNVRSFPISEPIAAATRWVIEYGIGPQIDSATRIVETRDGRGALLSTQAIPNSFVRSPYREIPAADLLSPRAKRRLREIDLRDGAWIGAANPLLILAGDYLVRPLFPEPMDYYSHMQKYPMELGILPERPWVVLTMGFVLLGSGAGAFFLASVYRLRRRWVWVVLALMSGPATLLALVGTFRLPAWRRCPSCGKFRVLSEDACQHCQAAWAGPARTGTEIFT